MTDARSNAELTEATASGLRWITIARVAGEILLLASMVFLARLIPPAAFGMFAVALIVQELAITVPGEGVGGALVQRKSLRREHLQAGLTLCLLAGAALGAITLLVAETAVEAIFGQETARLIALSTPWFLLGALSTVPMATLRRRLDFRRLSLVELTATLVRTVASLLLAILAGLDASALVLGGLAGAVASTTLAICFAGLPLPRWSRSAMRDLLGYGGPAALASISWVGFRNGDYAIIGARLGAAQAGFYWRAYQLAVEYQKKISLVMYQVAFPVLSRTTGIEAMFALRRRMVQLLTVVLFPLLVTLVLVAPEVVPWLFGPAWEPAVLPTQILAAGGAATLVIDAVGSVLMAAGRSRALLGYGVAHFGVYAGAVFVAASSGLVAVCIAATVVHVAFLLVAYWVLLRGLPERPLRCLWDDIAAATVACVGLLALAAPASWALGEAGAPVLVHLAVVSAAGAVGYLLALRALFPAAARDLSAVLRRVLPHGSRGLVRRRTPLAGAGSSS